METIALVILSYDWDYSFALGEALSVLKNNYIVSVCKDEAELSRVTGYDILLLDLEGQDAGSEYFNDKRTIKLTESRNSETRDIDKMDFTLYKFSKVMDISSDIMLYHGQLTGKRKLSWANEQSKIIVFASSRGGVGKTTVAFGVGQGLRRYYSKSVLYLCLEEIESTLHYMKGREGGPCICEYLYRLFKPGSKKPDFGAFMTRDRYGVCAFMPDKAINRLRELDVGEMELFLSEISNSGAWEYILVDTGECFSDEIKFFLDICNKAVVVLPPEEDAGERETRFMNYLHHVMGKGADERLLTVCNKSAGRGGTEGAGRRIYIESDKGSLDSSGETIEISIDQDFGSGIRELVKNIV